MKKLLVLAALSAGSQALHAQTIAAGTVSLGGSVGYNQYSGESSTVTSSNSNPNFNTSSESTFKQFNLMPTVGYFVADNLAVGVVLGYSSGKRTDNSLYNPNSIVSQYEKAATTSLRAGAFAQYYKMLTDQFGITGRLGAGYQRLKEDRDGYTTQNASTNYFASTATNAGYYAEITPGIIYFPVPKFSISASIGSLSFNHYGLVSSTYSDTSGNSYSNGGKNDSNAFGAAFGLDSFLLGGAYYFGR